MNSQWIELGHVLGGKKLCIVMHTIFSQTELFYEDSWMKKLILLKPALLWLNSTTIIFFDLCFGRPVQSVILLDTSNSVKYFMLLSAKFHNVSENPSHLFSCRSTVTWCNCNSTHKCITWLQCCDNVATSKNIVIFSHNA